jgi:hypothetical protein
MRTLTVTALAATGLLGLAPAASATHATHAGSHLTVTGQAIRWTVTNTGDGHLDHVRLVSSVPTGWLVKDGPGCTHTGTNLRCDLGGLDAGRRASVQIPMIVHKPLGAVQLRAWATGSVGRLSVPGPETSFRVVVVAHR